MTYVRQGTGSLVIFCVFVARLLGGCGGPESEGDVCEPDGAAFTCVRVARPILGAYDGTVQDPVAGVGRAQLVLRNRIDHPSGTLNDDEGFSEVSGNWQATFPNPADNTGGFFAGVLQGLLLTGTVISSDPTRCSFDAQAVLIDENRLQGTYTSTNCPGRTGTFDIRK
jgi:hypothetical protein